MCSKCFLVMIAEGDEQKEPRQEGNDDDSDRRPREKFEVEMVLAKKPRCAAAEETSTNLGFLRYVGLGHYKFHKANSLPLPPRLQPDEADS
jgi:hypothetical protein